MKHKITSKKKANHFKRHDILPVVLDKYYDHEMQTKVTPVEGIFLKSSGCEEGLW